MSTVRKIICGWGFLIALFLFYMGFEILAIIAAVITFVALFYPDNRVYRESSLESADHPGDDR
ncbi:hypothetical protein JMM81_20065 [Bacillus sp. V3B]|uniref:hypothetical protein n=1 Tax=Bacillus sp. V3B TaxID=2804915 RepID=UPI00210AADE7|nr:hypothetical protein [Bacillus sp. V3B]MCQ6277174.1 hypothetical protein [Bacillus sp. V3B]